MRYLLPVVSTVLLSLLLIACPSTGDSDGSQAQGESSSEEAASSAEAEPLTQMTLFDGGMEARLPCEPQEPEESKESEDLRAATCQASLVHVTALWFNPGTPGEFDLKEDGESVLSSAGAALKRRDATHVASESADIEIDGRPALRTQIKGMIDDRPVRVEALVVEGDQGGWGLQVLYNSDNEAAEAQVDEIFESFHVEGGAAASGDDEAETESETQEGQEAGEAEDGAAAEESEEAPAS